MSNVKIEPIEQTAYCQSEHNSLESDGEQGPLPPDSPFYRCPATSLASNDGEVAEYSLSALSPSETVDTGISGITGSWLNCKYCSLSITPIDHSI